MSFGSGSDCRPTFFWVWPGGKWRGRQGGWWNEVYVASGKGGTGKTTIAVNVALSLGTRGDPVELVDCDVEEPNDHLLLKPVWLCKERATVTVAQGSA
ncbi:MAG: P-loop NTPase [Bacillota bacterium]